MVCKENAEAHHETNDEKYVGDPLNAVRIFNEKRVDENQFSVQLHKALDHIGEDKKTVFLMRHQEGFSIKEISIAMDCSEGTVKSRLFYANKYLSKRLQAFAGS